MMKYTIQLLLLSTFSFSQNNNNLGSNNYSEANVEETADFPGGTKALMKYLQDSVISKAQISEDESANLRPAFSKFLITETGEITKVQIIRSSNIPKVDSLFKKAIEHMPNWKPAKLNGVAKSQDFTIPLMIELK